MYCHVCHTQNDAMSAQCFQCRTSLISTTVARKPDDAKFVASMDRRIHGGVGGGIGFAIGILAFRDGLIAFVFGAIGAALGAYIAAIKHRNGE